MDRIEAFYLEEIAPAQEDAVLGAVLAALTFVVGAEVIYMKAMSKKNAEKKATTQRAYFEAHEIPVDQRASYPSKVEKMAREDFESALKQVISNPKKSGLDKVKARIINEIKEYIDDGGEAQFEPNKVDINVTTRYNDNEYEIIDTNYKGKGFIPADNVWEIGQIAIRPLIVTIIENIRKKYAEEIKCGFLRIDIDSDYATLVIYAPKC